MKREIKFRAICDYDDTSGMVYFEPAQCDNGVFCMPTPNNINHIDEYLSPLMQYTGLLDKKGKEIYEGDILQKDNGFIGNVIMRKENGQWIVIDKYGKTYADLNALFSDGDQYRCDQFEVIGNIYKDADLLKTEPTYSPDSTYSPLEFKNIMDRLHVEMEKISEQKRKNAKLAARSYRYWLATKVREMIKKILNGRRKH